MTQKIDGMNGMPGALPLRPGALKPHGGPRPASDGGAVSEAPDAAAVSLSADARQLQDLHAAVRASPEVNDVRVDQVRRALADGSYKIDSRNIADRLLALDRQLPR